MALRALWLISRVVPYPKDMRMYVYRMLDWLDIAMVYEAMTGKPYGDPTRAWMLACARDDELSKMLYKRVEGDCGTPDIIHPTWVLRIYNRHTYQQNFVKNMFSRGRGCEMTFAASNHSMDAYAAADGIDKDVCMYVKPMHTYNCNKRTWREVMRMGAIVSKSSWVRIIEDEWPESMQAEVVSELERSDGTIYDSIGRCKTLNWVLSWAGIDRVYNVAIKYIPTLKCIKWLMPKLNMQQRAMMLARRGEAWTCSALPYDHAVLHQHMTWEIANHVRMQSSNKKNV